MCRLGHIVSGAMCLHPEQWAPRVEAQTDCAAAFKKKPSARRLTAWMEEAVAGAAEALSLERKRKRATADDSSERPVSSAASEESSSSSDKKKKADKSKRRKRQKPRKRRRARRARRRAKGVGTTPRDSAGRVGDGARLPAPELPPG